MGQSQIESLTLYVASEENTKNNSFVQVSNYDFYRNNQPCDGGLYDRHMGVTDHYSKCDTCFNNSNLCPGHPGFAKLNFPVFQPIFMEEIRVWLKIICFTCGKPVISLAGLQSKGKNKLKEAATKARQGFRNCIHCGSIHPFVLKEPTDHVTLFSEIREKVESAIVKRPKQLLYQHKVREIFDRVTDQTVLDLGKPVESHPRNFVPYIIPVPSNATRPEIKKFDGGKSNNDDITMWLQVLLKANAQLPTVIPDIIDDKLSKQYILFNTMYFSYIRGSAQTGKLHVAPGKRTFSSVLERHKGKTGRIRGNLLGKRCWGISRSVIIGDPRVRIDEIMIPLAFSRAMQQEETVQVYNKDRLMVMFRNGRNKYPGCTKVIKKSTGATHAVDNIRDSFVLEYGDIIVRDLVDGDRVFFNRAPTLLYSGVSAHKVLVDKYTDVLAFGMNVLTCPLYNADFDGDQMNIHALPNIMSQNEAKEMSGVHNWMISYKNSTPTLGQAQDSVIGSFEMTRSGILIDKLRAMRLFGNTNITPIFTEKLYSGRDILSMLLPDINFQKRANFYDPSHAPYQRYDPTEINVEIKHGKILSGVLDKKSIGEGAANGLFHVIYSKLGAEKVLDVIFNYQQIVLAYILNRGFSMGIKDMLVSEDTQKKIYDIEAGLINESYLITDSLINGNIIPPLGKTVSEYYEEMQMGILRDDFMVLLNSMTLDNSLYRLHVSGSKGKWPDLTKISASVGQVEIRDKRIQETFSHRRTLPYFARFDTDPRARGFIPNSYISGMTVSEFIFKSMNSRRDIISVALGTAVTGDQCRISVKNLESLIVDFYHFVMRGQSIIQFSYGEDNIDPRKLLIVKFPTTLISDSELEQNFTVPLSSFSERLSKDEEKIMTKFFDEELKTLRTDRDLYRKVFFQVEKMNMCQIIDDTKKMPFDVYRIKEDVLYDFKDKNISRPSLKDLVKMKKDINRFCDDLGYIMLNEDSFMRRIRIPEHIRSTTIFAGVLIRSILNIKELLKMNYEIVNIILTTVRNNYMRAIIDPGIPIGILTAQCTSESTTQESLDTKHGTARAGATKKGIKFIKELLEVKPIERLSSPKMMIYMKDGVENVPAIANTMEIMKVELFVTVARIFFEKYGESVHPKFKHENQDVIGQFQKYHPLIKPPSDLTKWCIHLEINRVSLITKNMGLEQIVECLRKQYRDAFIVHTDENAKQIIIRIYFRASAITKKGSISLPQVIEFEDAIINTAVRGVSGIRNTMVQDNVRHSIVADDGSVTSKTVSRVLTTGTNIYGIVSEINEADPLLIQTDVIGEFFFMFGIEATRLKIMNEFRALVGSIDYRHHIIFADEMTSTGKIIPFKRGNVKQREPMNMLLHLATSAPRDAIENASVNAIEVPLTGFSAPLIVGQVPKFGTLYSQTYVNAEFVRANTVNSDDILDSL
jgi:DNA-directed RNA polymerase II subunit RPB1